MSDTAEQTEFEAIAISLQNLEGDALPITDNIKRITMRVRKAMAQDPVDTLTLSNKLVDLAIELQRLGDRISMMGYITHAAKDYYERTREEHKVRLVQVGERREVAIKNNDVKKIEYVPVAAGVADSIKVSLSKEEFDLYNRCNYRMDQLVYMRKSADKTIDAIRTKISYEKSNETNTAKA